MLKILSFIITILPMLAYAAATPVENTDGAKQEVIQEQKNPEEKVEKKAEDKKPEEKAVDPVKKPEKEKTPTDKEVKTQTDGPPFPFVYKYEDEDQLACPPTPFINPDRVNMKPIKNSNHLIRKAGSALQAEGKYTQITGRVLDENCMPIQGAVVEIWQADRLGNYEWEYDTSSQFQLPLKGKDKDFQFSGKAQTDNLGQFNLLTIFPGSKGEDAPHINFIVKRTGYQDLETRMYFSGHPRNEKDPMLISLGDMQSRGPLLAKGKNIDPTGSVEGRVYSFTIVMDGVDAYKRY